MAIDEGEGQTLHGVFEKFLLDDTKNGESECELSRIGGTLDQLLAQIPLFSERNLMEKAREDLAMEYIQTFFQRRFLEHYSMLSSELFTLRRRIFIPSTILEKFCVESGMKINSVEPIEIPSVSWAKVDKPFIFSGELHVNLRSSFSPQRLKYSIQADAPFMPHHVRTQSEEALAFCYEILAEFLKNSRAKKYLGLLPPGADPYQIQDVADPYYFTVWKPTPQEFAYTLEKINQPAVHRSLDPVSLLHFFGNYFVVGWWDIPDEEPLQQLVREFTQIDRKQ